MEAKKHKNIGVMWVDKISDIVCINLSHREDRLLEFAKQADEYSIPFKRVEAIYDQVSGARGLMNTMISIFSESISRGIKNLLVFEDDAHFKVPPDVFNDYFSKAISQLPENYHLCFLGCQLTGTGSWKYSSNLIKVSKGFSTHAVLWSLQGMKEVMTRGFGYPIDNWMVDNIEPLNQTYCVYPLLASQRPGHSDICNRYIDWTPFIDAKYQTQINEMDGR